MSGKAAVSCQHTMGIQTAYGERRAEKVAHAPVKRRLVSAVVDRELYRYNGDFHIAHEPVALHVQKLVIDLGGACKRLLGKGCSRRCLEGAVVSLRTVAQLLQLGVIEGFNAFRILRFDQACVFLREPVGDQGIKDHDEGKDKKCCQKCNFHFLHPPSFRNRRAVFPPSRVISSPLVSSQ